LYELNYRNDLTAVMGVNFKLWGGRIKLGANARVINRVEINEVLPSTSTNLKRADLADEGIGVASDIGLILTAPWKWLPTVAAVWRDVGGTSYHHSRGMLL